ncbi:IS5-like element ISCaa6 family transposase [Candidatus Amoebophilus asiaticus]|uniref:IS5-like element ISCaa6 family transposase n=1 Tax=Candidatus Amoebophilus asiaticus TaxID=281120 RepID=UPI000175F0CF|nr:IS5-like element ISCaa6 family transposase [Candidatus Amoebophilus asiaticus]
MHLTYTRISKYPYNFRRITGLRLETFDKLVQKVRPVFEKLEASKLRHGRRSHLPTLEDKLLCVLVYYRTYISHVFLGYLFNLHNANICRLLRKMEPLLAKKISIKKDRSLTSEKVLRILADVSEQPTQRPSKKQKKSYSGKKKRHTIKTEIVIREDGRILSVSKSHKGRVHDFKIRKGEKPLPKESLKLADSGYQGWQKLQSNVMIPYKKSRKRPLTKEQKDHNRKLASIRMKVEHKIREIKVFKIMAEVYRNFQKKYNLRFNIISGLINFKYAF